MNRRSIMKLAALAFAFATPTLPARAKVEIANWKEASWGREVVVCDGKCSFLMLPLLTGRTPDSLVYSLSITHIFYGEREMCEVRLAEQEARHVGRPAALLAVMGSRENNYNDTDLNT